MNEYYSGFYEVTPYDIQHFGILGMKWGVRRYQNADGSYTQEGLRRYRLAEEKYNNANTAYKQAKATGNKASIATAKADRKAAKATMDNAYSHLKLDRKADRGKMLYASGKTVAENNNRNTIINATAGAVALGAKYVYDQKSSDQFGLLTLGQVRNEKLIDIGASAVSALSNITTYRDNSDLRAYYGHTYAKV